jgi:hypothetical protein
MSYRIIAARLVAAVCAVVAVVAVAPAASAKQPGSSRSQISYRGWTSTADFASGTFAGAAPVAIGDGAITFGAAAGTLAYDDPFDSSTASTTYDYDTWTSPVYAPGFGLTELVASWTADTPSRRRPACRRSRT